MEVRAAALPCTFRTYGALRWHLVFHLAVPMAVSGDGMDKLRRHIGNLGVTADNDTLVWAQLIASGARLENGFRAEV